MNMSYEEINLVLSDSQYLRGSVTIVGNTQLERGEINDCHFYQLSFRSTVTPSYNPRVFGIIILFYLSGASGKEEAKKALECLERKKFEGPIVAFPVEDPDKPNIRTDPLDRRDYPSLRLGVFDYSRQVLDSTTLPIVSGCCYLEL
jgi:hypothetical protein